MAQQPQSDHIVENIEQIEHVSNPENLDRNLPQIIDNKQTLQIKETNDISDKPKQNIQNDHFHNNNQHDEVSEMQQASPRNKGSNIRTQQNQNEQQEYSKKEYSQLSYKLQSALNKIEKTKNKQMNKSVSQSQSIIVRFEEIEERKKREIMRKKEQCEKIKYDVDIYRVKELKEKPTIDKNSQKISKQLGHKPIHLRYEKLMEQKRRKFQENEEMKKKKEEEEVEKYLQQLNRCCKKPEQVRSYEQYFSEMIKWKSKRTQENKQKHEMNKDKQLEGITFRPTLNKKSQKMIASQHRIPIEQRPLKKNKPVQQSTRLLNQKSTKL